MRHAGARRSSSCWWPRPSWHCWAMEASAPRPPAQSPHTQRRSTISDSLIPPTGLPPHRLRPGWLQHGHTRAFSEEFRKRPRPRRGDSTDGAPSLLRASTADQGRARALHPFFNPLVRRALPTDASTDGSSLQAAPRSCTSFPCHGLYSFSSLIIANSVEASSSTFAGLSPHLAVPYPEDRAYGLISDPIALHHEVSSWSADTP